MTTLRWITVLPSAFIASWLASTLFTIVNNLLSLPKLYTEIIGHLIIAAIFVYVGAKIAPTHKKIVANVLAGVGVLKAVVCLYIVTYEIKSMWATLNNSILIIGFIVTTYCINTDRIKL